ncbi:hypothetical protein SAMN04488130_101340 [Flavobacterium urumqiense]|uniref:Uncharacterized protein n=1 Tax=Flavobacterium urumqiense TaxID=935224 RepID=A0A1H5SKU2_9FLAO|nr:hypothetical protein SAMN04488130_101340 [Flavobacterium urumqiense]
MVVCTILFYFYQNSLESKNGFTNFKTYILKAILFNNIDAKLNK